MGSLLILATLLSACGDDSSAILTLPSPTAGVTQPGSVTQAPATASQPSTPVSTPVVPPTSTIAVIGTPSTTTGTNTTTAATLTTAPASTTAAALTTAVAGAINSPGTNSTAVPRFEATTQCPYTLPADQRLGQTVQCGYVIVPEVHSATATGKTIKLAVVVFKSSATNPAPEPVVYLEGGPGGHIQSTIDLMTGAFYQAFTARGDAIFFDQRGVGNSQPSLHCVEFETQTVQDAPVILDPKVDAQHTIDAATACHDRLVKQGINLNAYNSTESAADVNDIRQALGYKQIDVYGGSYGTLLAQTIMRLFPQIVRSVILDSVVPPDANPDINAIASGSRTLNLIFQACTADTVCNTAYPDLKNVFSKTFAMLNTTPATVKVTVPGTTNPISVKVDGNRFMSVLFQLLYSTQTIELIPRLLYAIYNGNQALLSALMIVPFEINQEVDLGMYYSVECSEEWPFSQLSDNQAAVSKSLPELSQDSDVGVQASITLCQNWNVKKADQAQVSLLKSAIPTLVMEGQFDPITPPEYGQRVAQNLSNSYYVEFPASAHGEVVPDNSCGMNIMKAFYANPAAKPDSSCTSTLQLKFG